MYCELLSDCYLRAFVIGKTDLIFFKRQFRFITISTNQKKIMSVQNENKNVNETLHDKSVNVAFKLIILIYFFSGLCSLIYEVAWVRLLKLSLGNTVYASSIGVSVFMGGLALGSLIMSKYADQVKRRLRLYALLEIFATLAAISFPLLLKLMDGTYRHFYIRFNPSSQELLFIQIIVSALLLLIPAMIMGSTLPLIGRYVTASGDRIGRLVGKLYAINTLGASIGCFLAGFVLIKSVGVMGTIYIAACINFLISIGCWLLSRSYDFSYEKQEEINELPQNISIENKSSTSFSLLLIAAIFCSGLISIGYELIWMRSIVFLLGGPTYVFSAVLMIYLIGNVIGAWIGSKLSRNLKNPVSIFGISLSLLGTLGIFYINWFDIWQSKILSHIITATRNIWEISGIRAMFFPIINSFFLFIIPAITMGIGFPLALQAWNNYQNKVGRTTGIVYGINTIGAVLGGLLVGFLFIPLLGVQHSIMTLGLIGIWFGCFILFIFLTNIKTIWRFSFLILAICLTVASFLIPPDLFVRQFVTIAKQKTNLMVVKEGINTTVSVHQGETGELILATSGIKIAGDQPGFRITQKILGHLGVFLNNNTKQALSVGFGTGESSSCISKHNLKTIEVVEIAPEIVETSIKYFKHINLGEHLSENVHIIYMDAKNYLHLTDKKYDLIITDAINPKQIAENASLYTKEYFQSALERLNQGGILGCWLPVQEIPVSCINSILGTFKEVFPFVTIWMPLTVAGGYHFLYLAGSKDPQTYSPHYINSEFNKENVRESVAYLNFFNSHDVLSCYIGDQEGLTNYLENYQVNSDYNPFIEFNTDKTEKLLSKLSWLKYFINQIRLDNFFQKIDWSGMSNYEQENWLNEHKLYYNLANILIQTRFETDPLMILQNCNKGLKLVPKHKLLVEQEEQTLVNLYNQIINSQVNNDNLLQQTNLLIQQQPTFSDAWLVKSWVYYRQKNMKETLVAAENSVKYSSDNAIAQYFLGSILMDLEMLDKAIIHLKEAVQLKPKNITYRVNLGIAHSMNKQYIEATSVFNQALELDPNNYKIFCFLGELYNLQCKKTEAMEAYRRALQINPKLDMAKNKLESLISHKGS
jgi:spermidine synthase